MPRKGRVLAAFLGALALTAALFGSALAQGSGTSGQRDYRELFLDRLAAILGVERSRLDDAAKQAGQDVIAQAEQDGVISKSQADWMRRFMNQSGWPGPWGFWRGGPFHHGHWGRGWLKGMYPEVLDAAAGALGVSGDELAAELVQGKTLGEIADARGVDRQKVQEAMVAAYKQRLDQAVANGDLTQSQADRLLQRFQSANVLDRPMGRCWPKGNSTQQTTSASGTAL